MCDVCFMGYADRWLSVPTPDPRPLILYPRSLIPDP